jgi:hypothetical protein
MAQGPYDDLGAGADAQLAHDVVHVSLDGAYSHVELAGQLPVGEPRVRAEQARYLPFAVGELGGLGAVPDVSRGRGDRVRDAVRVNLLR